MGVLNSYKSFRMGLTYIAATVTGPTRKQAKVKGLVDSGAKHTLCNRRDLCWRERRRRQIPLEGIQAEEKSPGPIFDCQFGKRTEILGIHGHHVQSISCQTGAAMAHSCPC